MANYFISSRTQQIVIDSFSIQLAPKCLIDHKWFLNYFKMLWAREISEYFFSFIFWVEWGFLKTFRWYANQDVHMDLSEVLIKVVHVSGLQLMNAIAHTLKCAPMTVVGMASWYQPANSQNPFMRALLKSSNTMFNMTSL